jgi:hypothetical protein
VLGTLLWLPSLRLNWKPCLFRFRWWWRIASTLSWGVILELRFLAVSFQGHNCWANLDFYLIHVTLYIFTTFLPCSAH